MPVLTQMTLITVDRAHDLNWHIYRVHQSVAAAMPIVNHYLLQERLYMSKRHRKARQGVQY